MTNSWQVFKVVSREQFKKATMTLIINLLFVFVTSLIVLFNKGSVHNFSDAVAISLIAWSFVFGIVYIWQLAMLIRRQMYSNRYQLLPIATWKTYIVQVVSMVGSWLYFFVVQAVLIAVSFIISQHHYATSSSLNQNDWHVIWGGLVLMLLIVVVAILLINFVDLISHVLLNYLPGGTSKLVKWIIYLIVMVLTIKLATLLIPLFTRLIGPRQFNLKISGGYFSVNAGASTSIWIIAGGILLLSLVFLIINSWLVEHVETTY